MKNDAKREAEDKYTICISNANGENEFGLQQKVPFGR